MFHANMTIPAKTSVIPMTNFMADLVAAFKTARFWTLLRYGRLKPHAERMVNRRISLIGKLRGDRVDYFRTVSPESSRIGWIAKGGARVARRGGHVALGLMSCFFAALWAFAGLADGLARGNLPTVIDVGAMVAFALWIAGRAFAKARET
jgi:hypothetical protein